MGDKKKGKKQEFKDYMHMWNMSLNSCFFLFGCHPLKDIVLVAESLC